MRKAHRPRRPVIAGEKTALTNDQEERALIRKPLHGSGGLQEVTGKAIHGKNHGWDKT
jgi:predicted ATP-grasp superfamily ATP-dependent carboligase